MVAKILSVLERYPHKRYVEPFAGGASVLIAKRPVEVEVYNDADASLLDFFKVLADEAQFQRFYRRVEALPYSRKLWEECRDTWREQDDPVEKVARWFVVARQSFSGIFARSWSSAVTATGRGMAMNASSWMSVIKQLPEIHARLQRVQFECADFRRILQRYDTPETLFYCDPPYVPDTRRAGEYAHEMSCDDHRDLVDLLLNLKGYAVLSGYRHEIYRPLELAGWERIDFETACFAVAKTRTSKILGRGAALRKQKRVESVWCSPIKGGVLMFTTSSCTNIVRKLTQRPNEGGDN